MLNIGVLISGGGTNLQAIIDNIENGNIDGKIQLIISNKKNAFGLERGKKAGIESIHILAKDFDSSESYNLQLIKEFKDRQVDLIVLAGYLKILSSDFIKTFENRIINIHPSLIPSFSGDGFYGERVHQAVLDYGCKVTGATVHFVDEGTDTGPIILQRCIEIGQDESLETLQKKVLQVEHEILVEAVKLYCDNRIVVEGRQVK
ncbi:MAG TPA: phosphoribosylglycinamide formyltransferase, partial [Tissierellaceae bacterium]|nr:phosphoribosylglycinamide formyltransferase [Tissierellaceae bacterium]